MKETKNKKFKNNKDKLVILFDIIAIIIFIIMIIKNKDDRFLELIQIFKDDFKVSIFLMLALILDAMNKFFSKYFILIAIYFAFRTLCIKLIRLNVSNKIPNNIIYYREKLRNVTPCEISLISNLKIEHKKDIAATILDLYKKGFLEFKDNEIIVKNINSNQRKSEQVVLNMIKENDFSIQRINEWENICIQEASNDKYIKPKNDLFRDFFSSVIILILSIIIVSELNPKISSKVNNISEEISLRNGNIFGTYINSGASVESKIETVQNNYEARVAFRNIIIDTGLIILATTFGSLFSYILLTIPIYFIIKIIFEIIIANNSQFIRTKKGELLAEQILGLKNYIHDFSYLSEKNKENVTIWDEFLVYAVVLEENERIVDDILKSNNINIGLLNEVTQTLLSSLK